MMQIIDKEHCRDAGLSLGETNDCTVRACAVATQIPYIEMHKYLEGYGRKPCSGMYAMQYHQALEDIGVKLTRLIGPKMAYHSRPAGRTTRRLVKGSGIDYNAATVVSLSRELNRGTYLVSTRGHVLAMIDGVVHDWTEGRRFRVEAVHKVEY